MFRLERYTNIVRARAKIQNDYGLFAADADVRRRRISMDDDVKGDVVEDVPSRKLVTVFADETGKTDQFLIVAAVWVLSGHAIWTLSRALDSWQERSNWAGREIHFKRLGRGDHATLSEYLSVVESNRQFLSFKAIAQDRTRSSRKVTEMVQKLHEYMIIRGTEHEVKSRRIVLPYEMEVVLDEEQSLDDAAIADMHTAATTFFRNEYGDDLALRNIETKPSHHSQMIQLADLVAGALNRTHNFKGERNYKDELAEMIIYRLELALVEEDIQELDSSVWLRIR